MHSFHFYSCLNCTNHNLTGNVSNTNNCGGRTIFTLFLDWFWFHLRYNVLCPFRLTFFLVTGGASSLPEHQCNAMPSLNWGLFFVMEISVDQNLCRPHVQAGCETYLRTQNVRVTAGHYWLCSHVLASVACAESSDTQLKECVCVCVLPRH